MLNYSSQHQAAITGLQEVTDIVHHFSAMSWSYLHSSSEKGEAELKDSIVKLYTKILQYEVAAIVYFSMSKASMCILQLTHMKLVDFD